MTQISNKDFIKEANNYYLIRIPYTVINDMENYFINKLVKIYPYYSDGIYFTKIINTYLMPPHNS